MEPIELLRRLLDERGVEHTDAEDGHTQHTWWSDGDHEIAACNSGERLAVYNLTPEQAIAATLGSVSEKDSEKNSDGSGECRAEETDTWECVCDQISRYGKRVTIHVMECSACGQTFEHVNGSYEYCPHCRRRMVIE